jgi:hypothetical protein
MRQSLRGILPETETLIGVDYVDCNSKTACGTYGVNTCDRIEQQCNGMCKWNGSSSKCVGNGGNNGNNKSCSNIYQSNQCSNNNCFWDYSSGTCRNGPVTRPFCSSYTNSSACKSGGCSWTSSRCQLYCPAYDNDKNGCQKSGFCSYTNNNGQCDITQCSIFDGNKSECKSVVECSWDSSRNQCFYVGSLSEELISEDEEEDLAVADYEDDEEEDLAVADYEEEDPAEYDEEEE